MINDDQSARTHSDRGPLPTLRLIRRTFSGVGLILLILSAVLLTAGIGAGRDGVRALNAGLTLSAHAGMAGIVVAVMYAIERAVQYVRELVDGLEAGDRAIAGAVADMPDPPDEVADRRGGGR